MEKTFEELITENHTDKILSGRRIITDYNTLHFLMQQVREATIAECINLFDGYDHDVRIKVEFENMKTDRIKLTEK